MYILSYNEIDYGSSGLVVRFNMQHDQHEGLKFCVVDYIEIISWLVSAYDFYS